MGGDHRRSQRLDGFGTGSPPHGRGPPGRERHDRPPDGLTPAWAGTTSTQPAAPARRRAHPRMGGDHESEARPAPAVRGSPPHGRGPPEARPSADSGGGLTPAWAGTTSSSASAATTPWAHPRMGGDHSSGTFHTALHKGSPPHGRGPPRSVAPRPAARGLTPAWAGTTRRDRRRMGCRRAHPRMGGDHLPTGKGYWTESGSPPHGRGPPLAGAHAGHRGGLTPAWAGTTPSRGPGGAESGAHPRMGGDHAQPAGRLADGAGSPPHGRGPPRVPGRGHHPLGLTPAWAGTTSRALAATSWYQGSPPHGRGPLIRHLRQAGPQGLTPAWAGTTITRRGTFLPSKAHPRMGGDHPGSGVWGTISRGSPPHGRGPQPATRPPGQHPRLTPAWAGTTPAISSRAVRAWAHPRMGGDHAW